VDGKLKATSLAHLIGRLPRPSGVRSLLSQGERTQAEPALSPESRVQTCALLSSVTRPRRTVVSMAMLKAASVSLDDAPVR